MTCTFLSYVFTLFPCSELKDILASDSIEGDIPELLRSILAQDPNTFKGRKGVDAVDTSREFQILLHV